MSSLWSSRSFPYNLPRLFEESQRHGRYSNCPQFILTRGIKTFSWSNECDMPLMWCILVDWRKKIRTSMSNPAFQICCVEGTAMLAPLEPTAAVITDLLTRNYSIAQEFKKILEPIILPWVLPQWTLIWIDALRMSSIDQMRNMSSI